jgi:hypothetical protein
MPALCSGMQAVHLRIYVLCHMCCTGLIGTAPSQELLDIWNEREGALVEAGPEGTTLGGVLHTRPLGEHGAHFCWGGGAMVMYSMSLFSS